MTIELASSLTLSTVELPDSMAQIPIYVTKYFSWICARSIKIVPPTNEYWINLVVKNVETLFPFLLGLEIELSLKLAYLFVDSF
jgi:hypothetical protein